MTNQSKIALGILGAVAAGVVIGLLIAPEKGSDMRKRVMKTTGGWIDSLSHLLSPSNDGEESMTEENIKEAQGMPTGA